MVASEIAKGHTKGETTGKGLKKLAAAMLVAAALMGPNFAWAADMVKVDESASDTAVEVYTKKGTDTQVNAAKTYTYRKVAAEEHAREAADTEIKQAMTDQKTSTALHVSKDGNLIVGTKENQLVKNMKINGQLTSGSLSTGDITSSGDVTVAGKMAADGVTDETTKDGTYIKQNNTVGNNLVSLDTQAKANADAIAEKANATDVYTKAETDQKVDAANTYTYRKVAAEEKAREAADTELNERITNEANEIHKTTNQLQSDLATETADRKAADEALDSRAKALEDKTEAITYDKDSKTVMVEGKLTATEGITDGTTKDGQYVKADHYVGQNLNALDQGLQAETAARQAADTTLQTNIDNEAAERKAADTVLDDKITAETSARVAADTKLVEAVNSGLSLSNDNVLQKNTTTIDAQGNVTTSKTDANEMILNKGKDNQITLNENGIKVGTNSTVVDKDGVYTGGDTYAAAKAAMSADGKIKGANGAFTVDENGNVASKATITGETVTDGKGASMSNGTVTGKTLTDGIATITNGNINTSGSVTGGTVTSTGNISAVGDIHAGGAITGASASIQGALTAGSATITGDLTAGGAIQGKSISDGTATMQNGNLTGVKNLSAETITTSGDATIGGDLTVKGKLNVDEIDLTKSGIVDGNNVTASTKVAAGEITGYKKATSTKDGSEKESAIDYDENGTSTWAIATDADKKWNKSTLTVEGSDVTSKVIDSDKNSNISTQTASESNSTITGTADGKNYKSYITQNLKNILQGIKEGTNESIVDQTETGIKSTATDGKNTASTNLSNNGFNTYAADGTNETYTKQTAADITNTAKNGTIANEAKDITNHASENMTNTVGKNLETTVGGEMKTTVTGKVTEDFKSDLTTTIGGKQTTTVTGDVTEDYKANLSTTVGGSQTTTVTGDSSLTAENINNTAKNKITNKALDVETEAKSSIVNKVSNDYGSNTSTQLSYETKEEMSANGKIASYLRGAAEEKSQLTNGAKKTTIDTVAGQTNTNITDGTNTSNDLQKADQIASSVTDGTNTTVVNQNAKSLASSITDGAKANNTNSTVDKSEQLIKASDTQYSATSKTATEMEDALVSGSSVIDVIKNLDDAANPLIGSAVTDGTNSTGVTQTAKDITNTAEKGTIANNAKDITNNATENMTNTVGKDLTTTVGGEMKTTVTGKVTEDYKSDLDTKVSGNETHYVAGNQTNTVSGNRTVNVKGTETENFNAQVTNVKTDQKTSVGGNQTNIVGGDQQNTVSGSKTETVKGAVNETYGSQTTKVNGDQSTTVTGKQTNSITGDQVNTIGGNQTTTVTGDSSLSAKNITNTASEKITNLTGDNTVTSDTKGTTFENTNKKDTVTFMDEEKSVDTKKTTISGNTITTGEAVMDYADVMKDLGVRGNAAVDGNTTLGKEGANTTLTVNSKSTFNKDVTVNGTTTTDKLVVNNGATVTGGTTTDTLHVTSTATFDDIVTMKKDLNVGGNAKVDGDVTAKSFKVGDKTYINEKGINANNQVIRNVGQGDISEGSTDAVSGGQLYETNTRVSGLETRMGTVETRVDKLDGKIDKVGANAAAMANLHPLEFDEDSKWNIAAAVGSSGSETASAVGVFYRPNENVMVNASAAMGTGENMFGGGVSLRLGHGGNKAKEAQMKAAAAENKELRAKVDDLTARMDALLSVLNPNMSKDFPDVPENHWAYEAVSRLAGNGIVEGYEDGKYHGERQMTRYEMAEIIYNALSKGAKAEKKLVEEFRPELQAMAAQKKA